MAESVLKQELLASDYNQMRDDFNNPDLNSYTNGPGANLKQNQSEERENNKLFVSSIPSGLTEDGLLNIFSHEGEVPENVYIHKKPNSENKYWGFVTFRTVMGAQAALFANNKRPPYKFNVKFARINEDKTEGSKERYPTDGRHSSERASKGIITPSARGRGRLPPMRGQPPSAFKALRTNDEPFIDNLGDDYCPGQFSHCNTSFEQSVSNSVFAPFAEGEYDDGKRKMSMGRGSYITKQISPVPKFKEEYEDLELKIAAYLGNQSQNFLFDKEAIVSSETQVTLPIKPGTCSYCSRPAIYICSRCKSWYCTNFCRKAHWSVHKNTCVPRILEIQDNTPIYKLISETSFPGNSEKRYSVGKDPRENLRKSNGYDSRNESITEPKKDNFNIPRDRRSRDGGGKLKEEYPDKKQPQRSYKKVESNVFVKAPPSLDEANSKGNISKILENSPIPYNIFTKVTIGAVLSEEEFMAYKVDDYVNQSALMIKLNEYGNRKDIPEARIEIGEKCIAPYEGDWYRAEILQLFSGGVKVKFIDFGNESVLKKHELKMIPLDLSLLPKLAYNFVLALSPSNPKLEGDLTIAVKPIARDGLGRWIVHAEGVTYSESYSELEDGTTVCQVQGNESQPKQVKHFLSLIQNNEFATLQIEKVMNDEFLTGSIMDKGQIPLYKEISKIIGEEVVPGNNMKLVPGMTIAAKWKNDWYRGYFMALRDKNLIVALVDKGRVVVPQDVAEIPKKVLNIPECAVRVIFEKAILNKKLDGETVSIKNVKRDSEKNHLLGEIEGFGNIIITPWEPAVEEAGLECIKISSGSKVQISAYHSPSAVYVQSCDPKHKTMCSELLQDVASCTKGETLKRKPLIGEFLACRYIEDGYYYRAQVFQKEEKGDKYKVNFVDYGNTEVVSIADMRQLPDSLKRVPCCAVKVGLKDVPIVPFNQQCMIYLNELAAHSMELFLTYENDLRQVTLEHRDGDIINKFLCNFLEPSWNKPDFNPIRSHVFMASEIKYETWQKGSKFLIGIAHVIRHDRVLALPLASGLLNHVQCTLTPKMTEYCESHPNEPYNPRKSEVCLAKFHEDENWYRAICLKSYLHNASEVFYIDYGNSGEVLHRCIRKMLPEFMEAPAVLTCCKIHGLPKILSENHVSKLREYLPTLRAEAEVLEELGEGNCLLRIPEVEKYAAQLGIEPHSSLS